MNLKGKVLIKNKRLENEDDFDWVLDFKPPFGPYPVELKETYPFNAEVVDVPDHESLTVALQNTLHLIELNPDSEFTIRLDSLPEHPLIQEIKKGIK